MAIVEVLALVEQQLRVTLQWLHKPVPIFGFGEQALAVEEAPPRIVWVPRNGPVGAPDALGGGTNATRLGDGANTPSPLWGRRLKVDAHIWAAGNITVFQQDQQKADVSAAERLGRHLVAALHAQLYGSYSIVSEAWDTSAVSNLGVVWILGIVIGMPFIRENDTFSQPLNDFPITPQIINPAVTL